MNFIHSFPLENGRIITINLEPVIIFFNEISKNDKAVDCQELIKIVQFAMAGIGKEDKDTEQKLLHTAILVFKNTDINHASLS